MLRWLRRRERHKCGSSAGVPPEYVRLERDSRTLFNSHFLRIVHISSTRYQTLLVSIYTTLDWLCFAMLGFALLYFALLAQFALLFSALLCLAFDSLRLTLLAQLASLCLPGFALLRFGFLRFYFPLAA